MVLNYIYHITEFLQVNSELGQLTHGHGYAVYDLLAMLESKKKKRTSKCTVCKNNQWGLSIKDSRNQKQKVQILSFLNMLTLTIMPG